MANPSPQDSLEEARGTHDRAIQDRGISPRRSSASATVIPHEELASDQLLGRAEVKSIAPSGREVYDPQSRALERGIDYGGAATRSTGAGEGTSIGIEVPLLGHTEHGSLRRDQKRSEADKFVDSWGDIEGTPTVPGLVGQIFFPTGGAHLDENDRSALENLVRPFRNAIEQHGRAIRVVLVGFADFRGPEGYNQGLSLQRSKVVGEFLQSNLKTVRPRMGGVVSDTLQQSPLLASIRWFGTELKGLGEGEALVSSQPELLANDRRVDIYSSFVKGRRRQDVLDENCRRLKQVLQNQPVSEPIRRLRCVLDKACDPQTDDRYLNGFSYFWQEHRKPLAPAQFALLVESVRDDLMSRWYGVTKSDATVLDSLAELDLRIWFTFPLINRFMAEGGGVGTSKRILQMRDWISERQHRGNSVYACYPRIKVQSSLLER